MEYTFLSDFLDKRLKEALKREQTNRQTIHLYRCGESWLALNYSAFLIEYGFHRKNEPLIFHLKDKTRFIMVEIPASFVWKMMANHKVCRNDANYLSIELEKAFDGYAKWRDVILDD